jgi:hypothetical protein
VSSQQSGIDQGGFHAVVLGLPGLRKSVSSVNNQEFRQILSRQASWMLLRRVALISRLGKKMGMRSRTNIPKSGIEYGSSIMSARADCRHSNFNLQDPLHFYAAQTRVLQSLASPFEYFCRICLLGVNKMARCNARAPRHLAYLRCS